VSLERLWAGWRSEYVGSVGAETAAGECLFCALARGGDDEGQIVARTERAFAVLNVYPYTSGHLMVAPVAHESALETVAPADASALMEMAQRATAAIKQAYRPDGVNVGMNLGRAAGAGIPDHLHVHVLPRWVGDTNFMTSIAEARVMPEPLRTTLERLRAAWPKEGREHG
jgi:diadenosine tetraphosphate (Ap4A) HIT family hydrolase